MKYKKIETAKQKRGLLNQNEKIQALLQYLDDDNLTTDDITEDDWYFTVDGEEYLVLADHEANEKTKEYIIETVWAFNINFIIKHSSVLDFDANSREILTDIQSKYEDGNDVILKLIDNLELFISDAISADGRGHFLNHRDGTETEIDYIDEYNQDTTYTFFIYRIN